MSRSGQVPKAGAPAFGTQYVQQQRSWTKILLLVAAVFLGVGAATFPLLGATYFASTPLRPLGESLAWEPTLVGSFVLTRGIMAVGCVLVCVTLAMVAQRSRQRKILVWTCICLGALFALQAVDLVVSIITIWWPIFWFHTAVTYLEAVMLAGIVACLPTAMPKLTALLAPLQVLGGNVDDTAQLRETLRHETRERQRLTLLHASHDMRLRVTADAISVGAIIIDSDHVILYANTKAQELFSAKKPIDPVGQTWDAYVDAVRASLQDPDMVIEELNAAFALNRPTTDREFVLSNKRTCEWSVIPMQDNGQFIGSLILLRDTTGEHRTDAAKSDFMSLASHQLRSPLTSIRWSLGRLEKALGRTLKHTETQLLDEAMAGSRRMAHTIDTMLAISRAEAGGLVLEPEDVKLGILLNDVRVQCRDQFEAKHQTVTLECPPNIFVRTDASVLQEILLNLYSNAIKYTPDGGHISIRGATFFHKIQIQVQDDGRGIPEHQHDLVFSKFFRGDNTIAHDTEGTGLGLYLVSLLAKMLRGSVTFESKEGQGTTFTVILPSVV